MFSDRQLTTPPAETTPSRHICRSVRSRRLKHVSLFQFLAGRGGIKPCPDLAYILDGNPFVPGFGPLLRKTGMELDQAREAAVEARYLADPGFDDCCEATSTVNDLLELIRAEAHGTKQYAWGDWPEAPARELGAPDMAKLETGPMSAKEFHNLIAEKLGLSIYAARRMLGISLRQAYRYDSGETEIPEPVAKLLRLVVKTKTDPRELMDDNG